MGHLLITRDTDVTAKIEEFDVKNNREEKLLGVKIDTKLSFENHVSFLCKKASQKLHALARVINFVDVAKRKSLIKAFITSEFNYYPLTLICVGFLGVRFEVVVGGGGAELSPPCLKLETSNLARKCTHTFSFRKYTY